MTTSDTETDGITIQEQVAQVLHERGAQLASDRVELMDEDEFWTHIAPVIDRLEEALS